MGLTVMKTNRKMIFNVYSVRKQIIMNSVKLDPKVKELKKKADRYIDWYIAQQEKEEVVDQAEKKRIVKNV